MYSETTYNTLARECQRESSPYDRTPLEIYDRASCALDGELGVCTVAGRGNLWLAILAWHMSEVLSVDRNRFGTRIGLTNATPTGKLTHESASLSLAPVYAGASVLDLQTPQ